MPFPTFLTAQVKAVFESSSRISRAQTTVMDMFTCLALLLLSDLGIIDRPEDADLIRSDMGSRT